MTLNAISAGGVTAGFMRLSQASAVTSHDLQEFYVVMPVTGRATMKTGSSEPVYGSQSAGAVFMPDRPAKVQCDQRYEQVAVMVSRHSLAGALEASLGRGCGAPLEFATEMSLKTPAAQALKQALRLMDTTSFCGGLLSHPLLVHNVAQVCVNALLFGQPHNYSEDLFAEAGTVRMRPLDRAVDLMRGRPSYPWTVVELASEVSVSVRGLQIAFRQHFGTTPMKYLRDLRLEEARKQLSAADPGEETVARVASGWGFGHLGRFAIRYSEKYGEAPSQTLRKRPD